MDRAWIALIPLVALAVGCGEAPGPDLEKSAAQPAADLEQGAKAQTIEQWAAANPNNGAAGHGENTDK